MALKMSHTMDSGVSLPESYHKVIGFENNSSKESMSVLLAVFKDESARKDLKVPANYLRVDVNIDLSAKGNIFENIYAALKALPAYEGASDI